MSRYYRDDESSGYADAWVERENEKAARRAQRNPDDGMLGHYVKPAKADPLPSPTKEQA